MNQQMYPGMEGPVSVTPGPGGRGGPPAAYPRGGRGLGPRGRGFAGRGRGRGGIYAESSMFLATLLLAFNQLLILFFLCLW